MNTLFELDSKGNVRKKIILPSFSNDWLVDYSSSIFTSFSVNEKNSVFYFDSRPSVRNEYDVENRFDRIIEYNNLKLEFPSLVEFSLNKREDGLVKKNIFEGLRKEYSQKNAFLFEFPFYTVSKKFLLIFSWYSNKVYIYNREEGKRKKDLLVKSELTEIGGKPFDITRENLEAANDLIKQRSSYNGVINRVFYDDIRKLFYVLVFHEQKDKTSSIYGASRSWSLIVYNEGYEKLYEEAFEHDKYAMGFTKLVSDGLMIFKRKHNYEGSQKTTSTNSYSFDIFDFNY
jgi:hypothetical protein